MIILIILIFVCISSFTVEVSIKVVVDFQIFLEGAFFMADIMIRWSVLGGGLAIRIHIGYKTSITVPY